LIKFTPIIDTFVFCSVVSGGGEKDVAGIKFKGMTLCPSVFCFVDLIRLLLNVARGDSNGD
jgi:hypothetical protein